MRFQSVALLVAVVLFTATTRAQTTQPANGRLEYRAGQAFARKDYATALPLLRKVLDELQDRPAKTLVIRERIKICEEMLAKGPPTTNPSTERTPHPAPVPGKVLELSIKDLGNFNYDPDQHAVIPDDVKRLEGAIVRLRGYMIPSEQIEHITQFALVPSLTSCCYGQPPQIQHTILCTCPKGKAVGFDPNEVIVQGTLHVEEKRDDGYVTSIFQVAATSVMEAPRR